MKAKQITDQAQRIQALDPAQSFIVQAPAGSGKTELISQRFLKLLSLSETPESILAITFTRKAASEMRQRILTSIQAANGDKPDEPHKQQTWELAKAVLKQDAKKQWNLLSTPARLRIVTIDSFCASLTRQMPLLSAMGSSASPVDDASRLYEEAAGRTLKELENPDWTQDLTILMSHLGNRVPRIQQLLTGMLARRDQWLRHFANQQDERLQRDHLEQAFLHLIEDFLEQISEQIPAGLLQELQSIAVYAASNIDEENQSRIALWKNAEQFQLDSTAKALNHWQGLAELLLKKDGDIRKQLTKAIGIPGPSTSKDKETKRIYQQQKDRLLALISEVSEYPDLVEAFHRLRFLPALSYNDDQWQLVQALIRVLLLSAAHLRLVFSEQGQVDFSEISLAASRALGDEEQATDLALMLDYRIEHILVDEFQDTSHGQFELLEKLTRGWSPGDGRSLFLVGDPMQSIYRFREAEVGLYLQARQQGIGNVQLTPLYLNVNFRSQQGIVDWINEELSSTFSETEDISSGAVSYSPSTAFHPATINPAVEVHAQVERDDESEAQQLVKTVQQTLSENPDGSIAILARNRGHLQWIIPQLKQAGISFQAVDLDRLSDLGIVSDLYSLMRALHHHADRLYWLALLRSPLCGLLLNDLLVIANGSHSLIWFNCLNPNLQNRLTENGLVRLQSFITRLSPFMQQSYRMSLRHTAESAWNQLGGTAVYTQKEEQQAADTYFDLLDEFDEGGRIQDMTAFDLALQNLYAPASSNTETRVQIMTMHKSKGLEFDVVLLPGLGKRPRPDESSLLEWLERPTTHGDVDLLMAPIKASTDSVDDAISKSLKVINADKRAHEVTRLLYVAATRAKHKLHLFGHVTKDRKGQLKTANGSLLQKLWPVVKNHFETADEGGIQTAEITLSTVDKFLYRLPDNWSPKKINPLDIGQAQEEKDSENQLSNLEFDWASETARHVGTLTHRYLELIANSGLENWHNDKIDQHEQAIQTSLTGLGTLPNELPKATQKVMTALKNSLEDGRGQWVLNNHEQAISEFGLTEHEEDGVKNFIIDRTFIDEEGNRWIIDYKTGSHEGTDTDNFLDREQERYASQLEQYARLFSVMEDRPIRLALYFPLLGGWREWAFEAGKA